MNAPTQPNNSFIQTLIWVAIVIGVFIVLANDSSNKKEQERKLKQEQYSHEI